MLYFLRCARSSVSAYCPSSYNNQFTILLWNFKNPEETREQEEAWSEKNLAFAPRQRLSTHHFYCKRNFGKQKIKFLAYPTLSSNFVPCSFWVFGALKRKLCNRRFELGVEFVTTINHFFQNLPPEEFH